MTSTITISCNLCNASMTGAAREVINWDRTHPQFCVSSKSGSDDASIAPDGGRRETSR